MPSYLLRIVAPNQPVKNISLSRLMAIRTEPGAKYMLLDRSGSHVVADLKLSQTGATLVVEAEGQKILYLNRFYNNGLNATFDTNGSVASAPSQPAEATSPSRVAYESTPASTAVEPPSSAEAPASKPSWGGVDLSGISLGGGMGTVLLGGAALLGAAALAGGGKDDTNSSGGGSSNTGNTVTGTVTLGPLLAGHDLKVSFYKIKTDGTPEAEPITTVSPDASGRFSANVGGYQGVVLAKVSASQDANADYKDETEGNKKLGQDIFSVGELTGSTLTLNITPLTYLAKLEMGNDLKSNTVSTVNSAIARLFGVDNLHTTSVVTTNNSSFKASDGLNAGEAYGAVLAALSGADKNNNGNVLTTLSNLADNITLSGGMARLEDGAKLALNNGIQTYLANLSTSGNKSFVLLTSGAASTVPTTVGTSTAYTASAKGSGDVQFLDLSTTDAQTFNLNKATGAISFKNSPSAGEYSVTINTKDSSNNTNSQLVKLTVVAVSDTTKPVFSSGSSASSITEKTGANQQVYDADATDNSGSVVYSIKANSGNWQSFSINSSTGKVTLIDNPDYSLVPEYKFTVVASDLSGNSQEQLITLPVISTDTTAPTVSSVALSSAEGESGVYLNGGDVVKAAVTMSEATTVTGSPKLKLKIGDSTVEADLTGGSGTSQLEFSYTILAGQTDSDGISIDANSLVFNGATFKDARNNSSTSLNHDAVAAQTSYKVDTSAPSATLINPQPSVFEASNLTTGDDFAVRTLALGGSNGAVMVWRGQNTTDSKYSIWVQKLDSSGVKSGTPVALEADGNSWTQTFSANVASLGNSGKFAVIWSQDVNPDTGAREVRIQRFKADGTADGSTIKSSAFIDLYGVDASPRLTSIKDDGSFVTVWDGFDRKLTSGLDYAPRSVFVQRFDASGTAVDTTPQKLKVTGASFDDNFAPQVFKAGSNGEFLVCWAGTGTGAGRVILLQKYDSNGAVVGSPVELKVPDVTNQSNYSPQLKMLNTSGDYVVVWSGKVDNTDANSAIYVQKVSAAGVPASTGPTLLEASDKTGRPDDVDPMVAVLNDGSFVVAWQAVNSAGGKSIFLHKFAADGALVGNSHTQLDVAGVSAANMESQTTQIMALPNGGFVLAWVAKDTSEQGGDYSIYVQQFNADGSSTGFNRVQLEAPGMTTGEDKAPQLLLGSDGQYTVSWHGQDRGGDYSIISQQFNADGSVSTHSYVDQIIAVNGSVLVKTSEVGKLYLVHNDSSVSKVSDIEALSSNLWTVKEASTANTQISMLTNGLSSGDYKLYSADSAGNLSLSASQKVSISAVKSVALTAASGAVGSILNAGDTLDATVKFYGDVTITGTPTLDFRVGDKVVAASYVSAASSGDTAIFRYTIQASDSDNNGIAIVGDSIKGGSLTQGGVAIKSAFAAQLDNLSYSIDNEAPTPYPTDSVNLGLNEALKVASDDTGKVYLVSSSHTISKESDITSLSSGWKSVNISAVDTATTLETTGLAAGVYKLYAVDPIGNLSAASDYLISIGSVSSAITNIAVSATGASGEWLNAGDVITLTVNLSQAATVTGQPELELAIGNNRVRASYEGGSGSNALVFSYTVAQLVDDDNGITILGNSIKLNGGTINNGSTPLVLVNSPNADLSAYKVDTTAATISTSSSVISTSENAVVSSNETGTAYLIQKDQTVTNTTSIESIGDNLKNSVVISQANSNTNLAATGLTAGDYYLYMVDQAGNVSRASNSTILVSDAPRVINTIAISAATGATDGWLNAGDKVTVTLNSSQGIDVTGTPQLALTLGSSTVQASYASGSGSQNLIFEYIIQSGQLDSNGISIPANALTLNGGTLKVSGADILRINSAVSDNSSYKVDAKTPVFTSASSASNVMENTGANQKIYSAQTSDDSSVSYSLKTGADASAFTIDANDGEVFLVANPDFETKSSYNFTVVASDAAGNSSEKAVTLTILDDSNETSSASRNVVVFDLVEGVSSNHSGRTFATDKAYTIYIRVDSDSQTISSDGSGPVTGSNWGTWQGAQNLGSDDKIILLGNSDDSQVLGKNNAAVNGKLAAADSFSWKTGNDAANLAAVINDDGLFARHLGNNAALTVDLWQGSWANLNAGQELNVIYQQNIDPPPAANVLTTQGLA